MIIITFDVYCTICFGLDHSDSEPLQLRLHGEGNLYLLVVALLVTTLFVMLGCMGKYPRRTDCNASYEYDTLDKACKLAFGE